MNYEWVTVNLDHGQEFDFLHDLYHQGWYPMIFNVHYWDRKDRNNVKLVVGCFVVAGCVLE
jgi:hypothetical protein